MDTLATFAFAVLMFGAIPVYAVWQVLVLFRRRGLGLILSLLPVVPMGAILAGAVSAYQQDSNLWPLLLILASPVAVVWLWLVGRILPAR
jgi:hypothetical protein